MVFDGAGCAFGAGHNGCVVALVADLNSRPIWGGPPVVAPYHVGSGVGGVAVIVAEGALPPAPTPCVAS